MNAIEGTRGGLILAFVAALAAVLALARPALATYPGANGKLAFESTHGDRDILSVNLDGTGLRNLTANGANNGSPRWSPDGTKIAFMSDGDGLDNYYDLYTVNADGSGLANLSGTGYVGSFDWSPDSSKLVFSDGGSVWELWTVNADGSGLTHITGAGQHYVWPAWSPDGKKIAVEKGGPNSGIYTMNPDGTGETRLSHTRYEEDKPVWSPDGKKIAVTTNRETGCQSPAAGCYTIYVMNADGSQQTRLTADTAAILEPKWSPDGSRIAFLRLPDYPSWGYDIYTVNVDGSNERRLTDDPATEWFHTWSPDSGQLAFVREAADGARRIYLIDADGSGERFLANGFFPDWQRLVRSAFNNAAEFCKAQREASGRTAFEQRYRTLGSCVRQNR